MDALILSLPSQHSTVRMRIWRALKDNGWAALRDGVYVRPPGQDAAAAREIEAAVRGAGGSAMAVELKFRSAEQLAQARSLFDRTPDYAALVRNIKATMSALPRLGVRKARTAIARLSRAADRLAAIDFFPGAAKEQALRALAELNEAYEAAHA